MPGLGWLHVYRTEFPPLTHYAVTTRFCRGSNACPCFKNPYSLNTHSALRNSPGSQESSKGSNSTAHPHFGTCQTPVPGRTGLLHIAQSLSLTSWLTLKPEEEKPSQNQPKAVNLGLVENFHKQEISGRNPFIERLFSLSTVALLMAHHQHQNTHHKSASLTGGRERK